MSQKKKVTADAADAQQDGQLAPVFDVSSLGIVMGMILPHPLSARPLFPS